MQHMYINRYGSFISWMVCFCILCVKVSISKVLKYILFVCSIRPSRRKKMTFKYEVILDSASTLLEAKTFVLKKAKEFINLKGKRHH